MRSASEEPSKDKLSSQLGQRCRQHDTASHRHRASCPHLTACGCAWGTLPSFQGWEKAGWGQADAQALHLVWSPPSAIILWVTWASYLTSPGFRFVIDEIYAYNNSYLLGLSWEWNKLKHVQILRTVLANGEHSLSQLFLLAVSETIIGSGTLQIRSGSVLSLVLQDSHFELATVSRPV